MLSGNPRTWWISKFQLKWNLSDKSIQLGGFDERTSIQILDFRIERDIERNQEFSLFLRFMDLIQFSGIFHSYFFPSREFYKTLGLPNLEYPTFTQFIGFNKQSIFHDQVCSTLCSSGPCISY